MAGTINTLEATDNHLVLGESLRPLLTNAMGSSIEVFDTSGPAGGGPPPHSLLRSAPAGGWKTTTSPTDG